MAKLQRNAMGAESQASDSSSDSTIGKTSKAVGSPLLRHKFLLILGSLIGTWLIAAAIAIMLLHSVLTDLNHVSTSALRDSSDTTRFVNSINMLDRKLKELNQSGIGAASDLKLHVETLSREIADLGNLDIVREEAHNYSEEIAKMLLVLNSHLQDVATAENPLKEAISIQFAITTSDKLLGDVTKLSNAASEHIEAEQLEVTSKFRRTAVGLGITFLCLINISILVLFRTAMMILKPVNKLVEASRMLAREEFSHRVNIDHTDEFSELASAYNSLAEQLQANEQRKIETLRQVARTLNHELNNAISIIELQLRLLARKSDSEKVLEGPLHQIHETLARMSKTVDALKRVRRIVLTDYVSGVKMLDLERSVEDEDQVDAPAIETVHKMKA